MVLNTEELFIVIHFGYYPWVPKFWVPNPHGYPRVIPKKPKNFELYGYPTQKIPMEFRYKPNPTHTQNLFQVWVLPLGTQILDTQSSPSSPLKNGTSFMDVPKKLSLYIHIPNMYLGLGFEFRPKGFRDLAFVCR